MTNPARANAFDWAVFAMLAAMALTPAIIAGDSDFTYSDASRHAMDGVFVLDAAADFPIRHPIEWAKHYYLTSPALGIGRYPPLFAAMQAPFYAVLGVRPVAGRLAVAITWLGGLVFLYEAARLALGRFAAVIAAAALAAGPACVRWGGDVMLELPAMAFLAAAACSYVKHVLEGGRRHLTAAVILACLAGWVKQPAALLVFAMAAHLALTRKVNRELVKEALPAIVWAVALLIPLGALSLAFGRANVAIVAGAGRSYPLWSLDNWFFYVDQIPRAYLGWPLTVLAVASGAISARREWPRPASFFTLWAAVFYLFFSVVGIKSVRLAMFWMPALALFVGWAAGMMGKRGKWQKALVGLAAAVAVAFTYAGGIQAARMTGGALRTVAARVLSEAPRRVFYVGDENGTFIFRLRELAGRKRPVTVRDSKVFYHDFIARELGRIEKPWTPDGIREAVAAIAPDVVVVERGGPADEAPAAGVALFKEYVETADFTRVDTVIRTGTGAAPRESFDIYRYNGPRKPAGIEIPMPGVGMELELPGGG
jgi:hypothetical protein